MPISSLGGFGGEAGRDDRPVAKGNGHRVRSGLAAGGRLIRTIGTPAEFFLAAPSIPQFTFRNINRLPRDRDRWFESISLRRGVTCEPEFSLALAKRGGWSGVDLHQLSVGQSSPPSGQFGIAELGGFPLII